MDKHHQPWQLSQSNRPKNRKRFPSLIIQNPIAEIIIVLLKYKYPITIDLRIENLNIFLQLQYPMFEI